MLVPVAMIAAAALGRFYLERPAKPAPLADKAKEEQVPGQPTAPKPKPKGKSKSGLGKAKDDGLAWLATVHRDTIGVIGPSGMPPAVAYAQLTLETAYGTAGRGLPWGVKGKGDLGSQSVVTHEVFDHNPTKIVDQFARYSSVAKAAEGYVNFLGGKRYREGWSLRARPESWAIWVWGVGYATADSYIVALRDTSRHFADWMGDQSLRLNFTADELAFARELARLPAGDRRRQATRAHYFGGTV